MAIIDAIENGTFDYAVTFPHSPRAKQFDNRPGSHLTVESFLTDWWEVEKLELKASSVAVDGRMLFNQIIPALGHYTLTELKWHNIRDWAKKPNGNTKYLGEGKSPHCSAKTQRNRISVLRRALNEAVEQELIDVSPMAGKVIRNKKSRSATAKTPTSRKQNIDPFDHSERTALINTASGQLKNMVQFGFWTGLRLSEIFALNWEHIDWVNDQIYVEGALTQYADEIESTKTETGERIVELLPPALEALKAQKKFTYLKGQEVFQNRNTEERWTGEMTLRTGQWKTLCKRAGVRYRSPGQMRHTFASMTLMAGETPQWVAAQMGHTDWTFTARVYYRWIPKDSSDAGQKVTEKWGNSMVRNLTT